MRSDLKEQKLDRKLAKNGEAWRKAVTTIDPDRDKIGKGEHMYTCHGNNRAAVSVLSFTFVARCIAEIAFV